MKLLIRLIGALFIVILGFVLVTNLSIILQTKNQIFESPENIKTTHLAVILGTSRLTTAGDKNLFFEERMNAGTRLLASAKVKQLLVSGDNETKYYNEPKDMQNALSSRGVPDSLIIKDASGLRTFDSIVRLKTVFQKDTVVIITQKYHAYRALYIANHFGITAQAFIADRPVDDAYLVYFREWIARPLAVLDIFILNSQPKYSE